MKSGKATGPSNVSLELIAASGEERIQVMIVLCQKIIHGLIMSDEWALSIMSPIFMEE